MWYDLGLTGFAVILPLALLAMSLRVLREYERGVVFQLGRFWKVKGPGLVIVVPGIQQMVRVELRVVVLDIPSQDIITRDNVSVKVNAVLYFRVVEADKAIIEVENFLAATSQLAQTTLRAVLGKHDLDDLLAERDRLNLDIQKILDAQTEAWGIKVTNVEIKHVDLNETMVRAIARQAEAERERRAKVIHAEGELQASVKLAEAAEILARQPAALQLRYLETLTVIGADKNSTIVFPLPLEIIGPLVKLMEGRPWAAGPGAAPAAPAAPAPAPREGRDASAGRGDAPSAADSGRALAHTGRPPADSGHTLADPGRASRDAGRPAPADPGRAARDAAGASAGPARPAFDSGRPPAVPGRPSADAGRPTPGDPERASRDAGNAPADTARTPFEPGRPPGGPGRPPAR